MKTARIKKDSRNKFKNQSDEDLVRIWNTPNDLIASNPHIPLYINHSGFTVWDKNVSRSSPPIPNSYYSIELVTAGNCLYVQGDRINLVETGMVFLHNRFASRSYQAGDAGFLHKRWISVSGSIAEALFEKTGLNKIDSLKIDSEKRLKRIVAKLKNVNRILARISESDFPELATIAFEIILELSFCVPGRANYPLSLKKALSLIEKKIKGTITLKEIASEAEISIPHCHYLFTKYLKKTPLQYFIDRKISNAKDLLLASRMSIKEVAYSFGYNNPGYFSLQFKQVTGYSPTKFLKKV